MNLLLITTDQQRWDALGCNTHFLKTPALDRLAAEGIVYDRAYTSNPVCTPARCSVLTGEYPSRHGCYTIGTALPEDYPTVPGALAAAGCSTALIGKAHFQPCCAEPAGPVDSLEAPPRCYDFDMLRRWTGPYYGFQDVRLAIGHTEHGNADSLHYGLWLREQGVDVGAYWGNGQYTDFGAWALPEQYHNSRWTADETIAALDRARHAGRPFLLWASFQDPHNPCVVPEPWASMYRPEDMPEFGVREGEFDDKPPFYAHVYDADGSLGDPELDDHKPWYCFRSIAHMDEARTRRLAACYFGMVSLVDHHVGRILDHLDATGLADETVVVFTTDHGDYLGNHGIWWKGLPAYEDAQRLPFIVRHPECRTPGARSRAMQSLVDIGPTAMAELGVAPPVGMQGVEQSAAWRDAAASARDWAICEYRPTESAFMQTTLVHDDLKLVVYHERAYGELYDLDADPDQYHNLWDEPDWAAARMRMMQKLASAEMEKGGVLRTRVAWA